MGPLFLQELTLAPLHRGPYTHRDSKDPKSSMSAEYIGQLSIEELI